LRAADLGANLVNAAPTHAPQVVYQVVNAPAVVAAPAKAVPTQPAPMPTLAPQQMILLDREQWAVNAQQAGR